MLSHCGHIMMERDFMGLSSKESVLVVKEEINDDGCRDSSSGVSFSHSILSPPPILLSMESFSLWLSIMC